jgi:hypothetical protein
VPGFIDPVFAKTSPKRSFSIPENERSGLVYAKTGPINSVTGRRLEYPIEVKHVRPNLSNEGWIIY